MILKKRRTWYVVSIITVPALLLVARAVISARQLADESVCQSQLKQIGIALQNYYIAYDSYPPAFTLGQAGERMHSWRALLLPFIKSPLSQHYRYDQPWNSLHNQQFADAIPWVFRCPRWGHSEEGLTSYLVPVGPNYMFDDTKCRRRFETEVSRSEMDKIMVFEDGGTVLNWLSPFDDTVDPLKSIARSLRNGDAVTVMHSGGSVSTVHPPKSEQQIRELLEVE